MVVEEASDLLLPGCTFWRMDPVNDCPELATECRPAFVNSISRSAQATATIASLLEEGIEPVVQLVGTIDPDEGGLATERWFTEQFRLVAG